MNTTLKTFTPLKMRIFFIATKLNFNKSGSMVENDLTCRVLQNLGNEVTMLTAFPEYNDTLSRPLSYRLIEDPVGEPTQFNIQRGVYRLMKKYEREADIFYVEGQTFFYGAGFYRWAGGKRPVIAYFVREQVSWPENVSSFFSLEEKKSVFYRLKRSIRRLVEKYIFMPFGNAVDFLTWGSPLLLKEYEEFGLKTRGKSMTIGDPYPYDETMQKYGLTEDSYTERRKDAGKVILFYSNRMAPGKGYDILVQAFSKVKNKDNFKLVLGGDGPERSLIEKAVKEFGIEQYVEMPGWIPKEKFHESMQNADIFIYPRWRTAQPSLGLVEALTFGLPVIVPARTGLHWVAGKAALTFNLDDTDDLASKIELLGSDREMRKRLSRECYIRIQQSDINYKKTIPAVYEVMKELVKNQN